MNNPYSLIESISLLKGNIVWDNKHSRGLCILCSLCLHTVLQLKQSGNVFPKLACKLLQSTINNKQIKISHPSVCISTFTSLCQLSKIPNLKIARSSLNLLRPAFRMTIIYQQNRNVQNFENFMYFKL